MNPIERIRLHATTYTDRPKITSTLLSWSLGTTLLNVLFVLLCTALSTTLSAALFQGTSMLHRWPHTAMLLVFHTPLWVLALHSLWNLRLEVLNDRTSRLFQHRTLLTALTLLPRAETWDVSPPSSRYIPKHFGHELLGFPTSPRIPLDAVGSWSLFTPLPYNETHTHKDAYISIQLKNTRRGIALHAELSIPNDAPHIHPPRLETPHATTEIEHTSQATIYTIRFHDTEKIFSGFTAHPKSIPHKRALQHFSTWMHSLTKTLQPPLRSPEDISWDTPSQSVFQGALTHNAPTHLHTRARRSYGLSSPQDFPYLQEHEARQRHIKRIRTINLLGTIFTVLTGCALTLSLSLTNTLTPAPSNALFAAGSAVFFATTSLLIALRVWFNRGHHLHSTQPLITGPHAREDVVTLHDCVLSQKHTHIDLSTRFFLNFYRCSRSAQGPALGVRVTQDQKRIDLRVSVADSAWLHTLPHLESKAPYIDGHDFDTWLLPTLSGYQNLHTTPEAHTHEEKHQHAQTFKNSP